MRINQFEDALSWQKAKEINLLIYAHFKDCRDFSFKDQIQRAAVSVMNNIAEGFERSSDKELKYFLFVAKGSCGEVRSMLVIAKEIGYINEAQYNDLHVLSTDTSKLLAGFIKKL